MLVMDPLGSSVILTLIFGVALVASGVVRLFQAFQYWQWFGWLLLASGLVGILAGLVILAKWPISGLWVIGFVVGVDLLFHGVWWIVLGWRLREEQRADLSAPSAHGGSGAGVRGVMKKFSNGRRYADRKSRCAQEAQS